MIQLIVGIREGGVVTSVSDATSTLKGAAGKPTWGDGRAVTGVAIIELKGAAGKPTWGDGRESFTLAVSAATAVTTFAIPFPNLTPFSAMTIIPSPSCAPFTATTMIPSPSLAPSTATTATIRFPTRLASAATAMTMISPSALTPVATATFRCSCFCCDDDYYGTHPDPSY